MKIHCQTVEHPLGTLKAWSGATLFLTRTLAKARNKMNPQGQTGRPQHRCR
ncbi:hypothetical protein FHU13_004917 [Methylobacterium sp. R2-1]|nr:hypothetical protein [Methylobacterium sp. R2-1]